MIKGFFINVVGFVCMVRIIGNIIQIIYFVLIVVRVFIGIEWLGFCKFLDILIFVIIFVIVGKKMVKIV